MKLYQFVLFFAFIAITLYFISSFTKNETEIKPEIKKEEVVSQEITKRKEITIEEPLKVVYPPIVSEIDSNLGIEEQISMKKYVLSSAKVGIYDVSLYTLSEEKNKFISASESLFFILNTSEKELFFKLAINKMSIKDFDELFIDVTTNDNHTVTEDAYLLKELDQEMDYSFKLFLYDDYVSLQLNNKGAKKKDLLFNPFLQNEMKNVNLPVNENYPTKLADTSKFKKITEFKLLR